MRLRDLKYELPPERIAKHPAAPRDSARLLVASAVGAARHRRVGDLPELLAPGTLLVVNDTRVRKARLRGTKGGTGGAVELLLVRPLESRAEFGVWECMARASKPLRPGTVVLLPGLRATVRERRGKLVVVELEAEGGAMLEDALEAIGEVPLPPYLDRPESSRDAADYQTVFARELGASAAPTASLHFTTELVAALEKRGISLATLTLHVGLGTFETPTVEDLDDHPMHPEAYVVPGATARAIEAARARGAPVLAVGTTVVRALESARAPGHGGLVREGGGETRLLIQPGYAWGVVDGLLTNFHLPESTLLALVGAFVGLDPLWRLYREAIDGDYRFFSYGDAMLLERNSG